MKSLLIFQPQSNRFASGKLLIISFSHHQTPCKSTGRLTGKFKPVFAPKWISSFVPAGSNGAFQESEFWENSKKKARLFAGFSSKKSRQRPTLPHSYPCSTIGAEGLNFRVRNGNGCFPFAMVTKNSNSGILEHWNAGIMGKEKHFSLPNIPVLHHSTIP